MEQKYFKFNDLLAGKCRTDGVIAFKLNGIDLDLIANMAIKKKINNKFKLSKNFLYASFGIERDSKSKKLFRKLCRLENSCILTYMSYRNYLVTGSAKYLIKKECINESLLNNTSALMLHENKLVEEKITKSDEISLELVNFCVHVDELKHQRKKEICERLKNFIGI